MYVHILTKEWDQMRGDWNMHMVPQSGTKLCKGGADMASQVDMHTCTATCTHSNQDMDPEKGELGHALGTIQVCTFFACKYAKGWSSCGESSGHAPHTDTCTYSNQCLGGRKGWLGYAYRAKCLVTSLHATMQRVGKTWGVRWRYIHILIHVYILTKVWDQIMGDWDMHTGLPRGVLVCTHLFKRGGTDMGSQVDMYTCTDACTHSNQNFGIRGRVTGACIQGNTGLHMFMYNYTKELEQMWTQEEMYTWTDACTHSNQCKEPDEWWLAHVYGATHGYKCLHTSMQRI